MEIEISAQILNPAKQNYPNLFIEREAPMSHPILIFEIEDISRYFD